MTDRRDIEKYDDVLSSILVNEKSIVGFLSTIFNFLARRTDFYYVPEGPYTNMGFRPGVAEELVVKVLRTCDPKNMVTPDGAKANLSFITDISDEIMCSTVAHEEVVIADEDEDVFGDEEVIEDEDLIEEEESIEEAEMEDLAESLENQSISDRKESSKSVIPDDYEPPIIPTQKNSESYNGAIRDNYSWSQTIMDLDVSVKLPPTVKSSKELKVTINPGDISVIYHNGDIILKDSLPYKIKTVDSFWSLSEGKMLIHLEKVQERWWDKLLSNEEAIDLSKIDCSRPLDELPEDHIAKVRELQWNQEQKMRGLPTSDEIRNIEILKKAWNAKGSPFQGQEFDPSVLRKN